MKKLEYELNDEEEKSLNRFLILHFNCRHPVTFMFTVTGIGTNIRVQCSNCKAVEDISDYGSW